jgi:predicted KAP-like P-loop ATPase
MWHDNETTRDLIGFQRFADVVVALVTDESILPVTVGLFGDWGSGKSSVLRMVEHQLLQQAAEQDTMLALRFDGWLFEGYDDAKAALMTSIVNRLTSHIEKNQSLWERVKPKAASLLKRINWFRVVGLAAKGVLTLTSPLGTTLAAGMTVADVATLLAQQAQDPKALEDTCRGFVREEPTEAEDLHESVREFRAEFQSIVQESGISTLVVLVDDLDRCLPDSIVSTLEAIKLFLSVPGTAFVIAADERIVRHAIAQRYPAQAYQELDLSQEYLDKLVQIPCILPPMDEVETETYIYLLFAERKLTSKQFEQLCDTVRENRKNPSLSQPLNFGIVVSCLGEAASQLETDFALAARIAPVLASNLGGNPRLVKRFLNTFALRIRLSEAEGMALEYGVLAKLMVLERFHKDRFEDLYEWQIEQHGVPMQLTERETAVRDATGEPGAEDRERFSIWLGDPDLLAWLRLDPPLSGTNLAPYFYLARESFALKAAGGRRLSQEQQEIFALLQSTSRAVQQKVAQRLAAKPAEEIYPVYDALWSRVEVSPRESDVLNALFEVAYLHEGSARRLLDSFGKLPPASIAGRAVPRFARIGQHHPALVEDVDVQILSWSKSTNEGLASAAQAVLKAKKA